MATTSDQIQADIARTRARMSTTLDSVGSRPQASGTSMTESIGEQVRQRPLLALGLALFAGSLLKDFMSGGQTDSGGSSTTGTPGYSSYGGAYNPPRTGSTASQSISRAADRVGDAARSAGQAASQATGQAVDTVQDAAGAVVDTARDAAGAAVDTTANVARQVADTTGDVVNQVVDTAGDAAYQVRETTGDLFSTISEQVRQRPLVALGISLLAGRLLSDYMSGSGGQMSTTRSSTTRAPGYDTYTGRTTYTTPGYSDYTTGSGYSAADRVGDTARSAGQAASDAARAVVDTTGDVVNQVVDTAGDAAYQVRETTGDLFSTISEQVRQRPLLALGISLLAGRLLSDYMSGSSGQTGSARASMTGTPRYSTYTGRSSYITPGYSDYATGSDYSAADRVNDAARSAGQAASQATGQAVDTVRDAAGAVVDSTANVARQVADTTGDVVNQVVDTAGDAAYQVQETAGNLYSNLSHEIQERPLTALGVAIATGMVLQPTLAPYVSGVTQSVQGSVSQARNAVSEVVDLPEQNEVTRIRETLVPATVEQARQFASRDLREYLDQSLEPIVGQTSLRGGVVAAITEKAEDLVENRLPNVLQRSLQGTQGLLAIALAGAILKARSEAQQGQGQTLDNIKTDLAQSLTQTAREQLIRYFPAFREQYESSGNGTRRCSNCNAEVPSSAQFCPSCGTAVQA